MKLVPGTFVARPLAAGLSRTKEHKPTLGVRLQFVDGPNSGQTIVWWANFTDDSWKRSVESLYLLGWDGKDIRQVTVDRSREVAAVIETETFQGKERVKCAWINDLSIGREKLEPVAEREFAQWLQDQIRSEGMGPAVVRRSAPSSSSDDFGGDDRSAA